jgi:hypothetical protein
MPATDPTPFPPPSGAPEDTGSPNGPRSWPSRRLVLALAAPVILGGLGIVAVANAGDTAPATDAESAAAPGVVAQVDDSEAGGLVAQVLATSRSLDGSGNNLDDPTLGSAGTIYPRIAEANYADEVGTLVEGPDERYLSNRIFNDSNQNVFSENDVTHWGFVWGQFLDHTFGLRDTSGSDDEELVMAYDPDDPLESFTNDLGAMTTTRSTAAAGTGVDSTREQVNTVSSFIDAWAVYGGSDERLDWLREGSLDGDPTNNDATLLHANGYLPTAADRPDSETPTAELMGRLFDDPTAAVIAGDVRANENIGLTAAHTLFLREHNRIVDSLPGDLDEEEKFAIARRVLSAMQQYITYNEFLPAMGVSLDAYDGYDADVDPSISNEFATVGYRAHSQIHGELEAGIPRSEITDGEIDRLEAQGLEVSVDDDAVEIAVPLSVAFGNPSLLTEIGLGNMLAGLASEAAYANDEQIDNQLRSVLFQIPGPEVENPADCLDGDALPGCFSVVNDLGAIDVLRGADHGMPAYNDLRESYGLDRVSSFTELTGESTEEFPDDPTIDSANPIDDPDILDFVFLADSDGNELTFGTNEATTSAVTATRRTTTAARLKATFDAVDEVDAFTGMVSEPHVEGSEFGELQLAMWTSQFEALRDGDRFFYGNDSLLDAINEEYGIDYRRSLAEVIADNTDINRADLPESVFVLDANDESESEDSSSENAEQQSEADFDSDDNDTDGDNDGERDNRARPDSENADNTDRPPRRDGGRRDGGRRNRG